MTRQTSSYASNLSHTGVFVSQVDEDHTGAGVIDHDRSGRTGNRTVILHALIHPTVVFGPRRSDLNRESATLGQSPSRFLRRISDCSSRSNHNRTTARTCSCPTPKRTETGTDISVSMYLACTNRYRPARCRTLDTSTEPTEPSIESSGRLFDMKTWSYGMR